MVTTLTLSPTAPKIALSVYFYCLPPKAPEDMPYPHDLVCLAEGLKELGVAIYGHSNAWWLSAKDNSFLFSRNPDINPEDCSILVFNSSWVRRNKFPTELFHNQRKYITVYMDSDVGKQTSSWSSEARKFDFVFKSHYTTKHLYPSNVHPWHFGLSNRILEATQDIPQFIHRDEEILVNYRLNNHFPHSVRVAADKDFLPKLSTLLPINRSVEAFAQPPSEPFEYLQWIQTGRRHYPEYYQRLKHTVACACFGGYFVSDLLLDPSSHLNRLSKQWISRLGFKTKTVIQWDSWRFWEALAAGCIAFHLDFERYGFYLPVMPTNWEHYIGIDLDNLQPTINRLKHEPEILEHISSSGRKWVRTHYNPVTSAERFLKTILQ